MLYRPEQVTSLETLRAGDQIQLAQGVSTVVPSGDFETYSEAGYVIDIFSGQVRGASHDGKKSGLPLVGTPVYAEHPSTEVLCFYYDLKDGMGRRAWYPGTPDPVPLLAHVAAGGLFEAHNVTFEFWIWNMVCVRRYGWPPLQLSQCRCSMAKARRHSLPAALDNLAVVLGTPRKDPAGVNLMRMLSQPHTPSKERPLHRWTQATAWSEFRKYYDYCDQDVWAEDNASARIPDLTPYEFATWQFDQLVNARGVQVDVELLDAALDVLGQAERTYTDELIELSEGKVQSVGVVEQFRVWLCANGVDMPNMQALTVSEKLIYVKENPTSATPEARRALEIRDVLGSANVKKLRTLAHQISSDGRLRDQYNYCGADRTGRASAGGVQLQNITAKGPKICRCEACGKLFGQDVQEIGCPRCGAWMFHAEPEWTIEAVEMAVEDILQRDLEHIEQTWGDPIALLCGCLRGMLTAREGYELICVDFSAIEAVVAACLARCSWRINVFSTHGKIYEESASRATGIPLQDILDYPKMHGGASHPARKKIGKVRELAGGYGGWINAWLQFGAGEFMTDDEIKADVLKWRDESFEIVEMWGGQYRWCGPGKWDYKPELFGLEGCAIKAIQHPGQHFRHIDIEYFVEDDILFCRLPSGRFLHYHHPKLYPTEDKLRRGPAWQITFEGWNSNAQRGAPGWRIMETFGGRLFENCIQATAADIQFEALQRCEARGYPIVMHTHDEGTAEVPSLAAVDGHVYGPGVLEMPRRTLDEMIAIMTERPAWASWWPIRGAGWHHKRYQKD